MKNFKHLISVFVAVFVAILTSCSSNDGYMSIGNENEMESFDDSNLLYSAQAINNAFLQNSTRGKNPKKWIAVSIADAWGAYTGANKGLKIGNIVGAALGNPITGGVFGATIGAISVGAYKSYRASRLYDNIFDGGYEAKPDFMDTSYKANEVLDGELDVNWENINIVDTVSLDKINLDAPTVSNIHLKNKYLKIGQMHNIMLCSKDGSLSINCDQAYMPLTRGLDIDVDIDDDEPPLVEEKIRNNFMSNDNLSDLYEQANDDQCKTKSDSLLNLFCEAIKDVSDKNELISLINSYVSIVSSSVELTEDEKENIFNAFATAIYSFNYWDIYYKDKK